MAVIIGRKYESKLDEIRASVLSKSPLLGTRVLFPEEVRGQGRCYYGFSCVHPEGSLDWVEVTRSLPSGVSRRGTREDISRYFFHLDCLRDLLRS
jgi:hypothetical protein